MNKQTRQTENSQPFCEKLPETAYTTSLNNVTLSQVSLHSTKCQPCDTYTQYIIPPIQQRGYVNIKSNIQMKFEMSNLLEVSKQLYNWLNVQMTHEENLCVCPDEIT